MDTLQGLYLEQCVKLDGKLYKLLVFEIWVKENEKPGLFGGVNTRRMADTPRLGSGWSVMAMLRCSEPRVLIRV
ncbi:MAG: hypothetical protein SH818_05540 [Saprospiraceae bacterium]|nr:hypothetical protein [Saprospiraceae bacterium]